MSMYIHVYESACTCVPPKHVVVVAKDVGGAAGALKGLVGRDGGVGGGHRPGKLRRVEGGLDGPDQENDQRWHEQFNGLRRRTETSETYSSILEYEILRSICYDVIFKKYKTRDFVLYIFCV